MRKWILLEEIFEDREIDGKLVRVHIGKIMIPEDEFALIYEDVKRDASDSMGYKKYKAILKNEGFDIEAAVIE